ncbi:MAG TPA: vitamin K epoxide reductase family protein [Phycisphaerae bacterium]|nr:vitamin K epoxide reductase family protein [Phycisphaerae bacterium]
MTSASEKNPPGIAPPRPWPWPRRALIILSFLGLVLSSYLSYHFLSGASVIGCSATSACDAVLSSRFSSIAGVLPVSGLAAGAYLALFFATFFIGPSTPPADRRLAWAAILLLAAAAAGGALWFIFVQEFLLHAFCPWCMTTHIISLLLFALALAKAPSPRLVPTGSGIFLAALLMTFQLTLSPKPASQAGDSPIALPALDAHAVPLIGSPNAPTIVTLLFDYNCPHCQHLHTLLADAVARYHGQLAFVLCPTPLNMDCNPYIPQQVDQFKTSCDLAKLSLAVWLANPSAFPTFDDWLFSPDPGASWRPRSLDAARAKAIQLVGQSPLDSALANPWIPRFLNTSVQLFGNTLGPHQTGAAVPKLLYHAHWVTPTPSDTTSLLATLQSTLDIPPP